MATEQEIKIPEIEIKRCGMVYTDKVVVVTGGSMGIGEGCARVFVDAGARVVICARHAEAGKALEKELNAKGPGTCHFEICDVSQPDDIKRLVRCTIELYGGLDCLINNAGYHPAHKVIDDYSLEEFMEVLRTNLVSCFIASQQALPHLRPRKGSIINMSSLVGEMGQEVAVTYCATKGAINAFTKALAIEEARYGVRVNCVLPGNIFSNSMKQYLKTPEGKKHYHWIIANQHLGRCGTNEEVGQLCLFLASEAAAYITGITVNISAGAELGYGTKYPLHFVE